MNTVELTTQSNGLIEFILFGYALWFWVLVGVLFIFLLTAEARENGFWATVAFIVFCILLYKGGSVKWGEIFTWRNVGLYLGAGLIFATFRSIFYGRKKATEAYERWRIGHSKDAAEKFKESEYYKDAKDLNLKEHVFRWWLNWPGSLLWWVLSDWLKQMWDVVWDVCKKWFKSLYEWGFDSAVKTK